MLIGFLSDAHGNPFGLISCLDRLRSKGVNQIYFLGDAVGYLPHGIKVIEELKWQEIPCIKGNHDAMVSGLLPISDEKEKIYRLKALYDVFPEKLRATITHEWPTKRELLIDGKRILLVHGHPSNPLEGYLYEDEEILAVETNDFDLIVMGHTHRPFIRYGKRVFWLNAGSCGLPRDIRNMASCAVYDTDSHSAEILRVEIDIESLLVSCPPGSVSPEVESSLYQYKMSLRDSDSSFMTGTCDST